ncbi:tetratricopeptide repeat protein [Burkholderia alba]|uniref:tetratricopeptide repeat protein n=1 Tax=Burkholderia alba TaxID=2683677 RepID=UPI002B0621E7|nr:tetratricopeptide repeat protein [Burkholderia alba]
MRPVTLNALAAVSPGRFAAMLAGPPDVAAAWVAAAAENGIVEAQAVYGQYLLDGHGVARDPAAALRWFKHAAQADHPMAMNMLGRCYEFGWGTAACASVAVYWYRQAAHAGLDWGMYNYATALALGQGVDENRAQALAWFEKAAALGHAKSINLIGGFYEDGWIVAANGDTAFDHYRRAAEAGDFRGQFNYARLLGERGRVAEALDWLARVPRTATPAFVGKMRAFLADSPIDAFRAAARAVGPVPEPAS